MNIDSLMTTGSFAIKAITPRPHGNPRIIDGMAIPKDITEPSDGSLDVYTVINKNSDQVNYISLQ